MEGEDVLVKRAGVIIVLGCWLVGWLVGWLFCDRRYNNVRYFRKLKSSYFMEVLKYSDTYRLRIFSCYLAARRLILR